MKHEVTRDVVSDLWPLYQAGEASGDSRALVDAYLAQDGGFATLLKASGGVQRLMPPTRLSAEAEARLLQEAQRTARTRLVVIGGSVALAGMLLLGSLLAVVWLFFRAGH